MYESSFLSFPQSRPESFRDSGGRESFFEWVKRKPVTKSIQDYCNRATKNDSEKTLSAEDVALGYKQLMEVERAFRTLKTTLEIRPIYHRKDERIKAHVLLCFLALVLVRIAERQTGLTWDKIRSIMERIYLGEFELKDGRILQRTELTPEQANILKKLNISIPPQLYKVDIKG